MADHFRRHQAPAIVSCEGKDKLTPTRARSIAKKLRASFYHCAHCGDWHVGHHLPKSNSLHKRPRFIDNDEE